MSAWSAWAGVDRAADEPVAVEDPDLAEVPGVVADGHGLADVGRQGGGEVAESLEVDAVAVHDPRPRDLDEQQVEPLERVGGAGQPAVGDPGGLRRQPGLRVGPLVVGAGDPAPDRLVELGQGQPRRADGFAADKRAVAGQQG